MSYGTNENSAEPNQANKIFVKLHHNRNLLPTSSVPNTYKRLPF
jgi:hypothetical protein